MAFVHGIFHRKLNMKPKGCNCGNVSSFRATKNTKVLLLDITGFETLSYQVFENTADWSITYFKIIQSIPQDRDCINTTPPKLSEAVLRPTVR